jgi:hypothetical protein
MEIELFLKFSGFVAIFNEANYSSKIITNASFIAEVATLYLNTLKYTFR